MNLLKVVSNLREEKGCSIISMAKELNVSRDCIYKTLNSKKTELRNPTLHAICAFFGVTLAQLIKLAEDLDDA